MSSDSLDSFKKYLDKLEGINSGRHEKSDFKKKQKELEKLCYPVNSLGVVIKKKMVHADIKKFDEKLIRFFCAKNGCTYEKIESTNEWRIRLN